MNKINEQLFEDLESRQAFNKAWLFESPQRVGIADYYNDLNVNITYYKTKFPERITELEKNFYQYIGQFMTAFWFEKDGEVILGGEFDINKQNLVVNFVAKNKLYDKNPPYASTLYEKVLKYAPTVKAICFHSDKQLSDQGFSIWKKLLDDGFKISYFDETLPGQTYVPVKTVQDLEQRFGADIDYRRYRFVLSEENNGDLQSFFQLRRLRELSNLALD